MRQILSVFSLLALLAPLAVAAHEGHDHESEQLAAAHAVHELQEQLLGELDRSMRYGVPVDTAAERAIGRKLLDAAYEEVIEELADKPITNAGEARHYARKLVDGLNPIAIGRWLIETGQRHGPTLAIAIGLAEVSEQLGMLAATRHPSLLFLVPLYFTHAGDALMFSLVLGTPKLARAVKRWRRFGGLFSGPGEYYRFLVAQREQLPIDWSEVVMTSRLSGVEFSIITENAIERRLPRKLRVLFSPRKLAQRESSATVGVWELELALKKSGVDLRRFRAFRPDSRLYATVLLREIGLNPQAFALIGSKITGPGFARRRAVDAVALLEASSPEQLARAGESPDLVAQRVLWLVEERRERLFELAKLSRKKGELSKDGARLARGSLRKLAKLLREDRGLALAAATQIDDSVGAGEAWARLHHDVAELRELLLVIEAQLPSAAYLDCERLLLTGA